MSQSQEKQSSIWFFYTVAATLGVSFLVTLLVLAWNNIAERETQKFAYESLSIDDSVGARVRAADNSLRDFVAMLSSFKEVSSESFNSYTGEILERFTFIDGLGVYDAQGRLVSSRHGEVAARLPQQVKPDGEDIIGIGFASAKQIRSPLPTGVVPSGAAAGRYLLFQAFGDGPTFRTAAVMIDPQKIFADVAAGPDMSLKFYSASEGVGGLQLLYQREAVAAPDSTPINSLEENTQVRFERYSMRLNTGRNSYWEQLDKGLLFTGLVLGTGVTLLLIALARAKEIQARELLERNLVIEDQVRRQTRELAEARDQALEASRVKSDFLASMSHEIRTPLNAIIGMAELLSETDLSGDQSKYVGVFKNAGEALLSLVNDILDLSKIEAEQLILERIDFDLRGVVEQSVDIYALKTASKNVELAAHVAPDIPPSLVGDPSRLRQVILNLIGNAIKFTEAGEIVVHVRRLEQRDDESTLEFSVSDTGIGIPQEKLESIFGSFTQVDSSTTRKYGGTGLGLTISKKLVEMMGGRIWVESEPNVGSDFKFTVTFQHGVAPSPEQAISDVSLEGVNVLIVDDSDINRLILRETLQAEGAHVFEAATGEEALAEYGDSGGALRPFQLVLCDVQMPEMDGFAVIDAIAARGGAVGTVMMLTSSNLSEDLERAKQMGIGGYLVKPVKRAELIQAIGQVLNTSSGTVATASTAEQAGSIESAKILLVEDNPDNRLLIKAYLKREPYIVDEAENGEEAVSLFKANDYDLVLMDVQMPVMDGHAATREIRKFEQEEARTAKPVIALTAHAIKEDMEKSLAAGCSAHLTKPIKKQVLISALKEHLAS